MDQDITRLERSVVECVRPMNRLAVENAKFVLNRDNTEIYSAKKYHMNSFIFMADTQTDFKGMVTIRNMLEHNWPPSRSHHSNMNQT